MPKHKGQSDEKGTKHSAPAKSNRGRSSGPKVSNERRADVTQTPSHRNPYPRGLS